MIANDTPLGRFIDRHTLEFELHYPHPRAAVWRAITDPEALAVWFMPMTIDLREGGAVTLRYSRREGKVPAEGVITELVPGSVLEYRFEAGPWEWPESVLRFEVAADESSDGATLRFSQRLSPDVVNKLDPDGQVGGPGTLHPGTCAGWQGFFDAGLRGYLDGHRDRESLDYDNGVMDQLTGQYRQLIVDTLPA